MTTTTDHLHPDMTRHAGYYPCATCPDTTTTTPRNERLARKVEAAAAHLHAMDADMVRRAGENLMAYQARTLTGPEAEGVLSVTVESLLDIIERLSRDA